MSTLSPDNETPKPALQGRRGWGLANPWGATDRSSTWSGPNPCSDPAARSGPRRRGDPRRDRHARRPPADRTGFHAERDRHQGNPRRAAREPTVSSRARGGRHESWRGTAGWVRPGETPHMEPNAWRRNIAKCLLTHTKSCIPPRVGGHPPWMRRPASQMGNWSTHTTCIRLCLPAQATTASHCLPHLANTASRCPGFVRRFRPLIRFRGEVIL